MGTMLLITYIFMSPIQKIGEFGRARGKVYHFQKFRGTLKTMFLFHLKKLSLYIKEQSTKIKFKIEICPFNDQAV